MAIKKYNPTTPARRGMTTEDYSEITTRKPLKSLLKAKKQNAGRNNSGRITVRHRGGGVKRHYRILTHKLPTGLTLTVREIEYDPNRSARIARVQDQDGKFYYVLADTSMFQGKVFQTGKTAEVAKFLKENNLNRRVLIVAEKTDELIRATNNISEALLVSPMYLNVFDILNADHIVIAPKAIETIENWLGGEK